MYPHIRPACTHVERLLVEFSKIDKPTIADFAAVQTRGVMYDKLDKYRIEAAQMTSEQLKNEKHKSSRLAENMRRGGETRPSSRCDCHAIISGGMKDAIALRALMAWLKVRIDDPHNGCWLPRDWDDRQHMPNHLRKAIPHKRIHHMRYYQWLLVRINPIKIKTTSQLVNALRLARSALQSGMVPPNVMPQTGR